MMSTQFHRYELPGIGALNFVIGESLGGGGVASLRIDPQVSIILSIEHLLLARALYLVYIMSTIKYSDQRLEV